MARKTVDVDRIKEMANFFLANSPDEKDRERQAHIDFVCSLLSGTSGYHGFLYRDGYDQGDNTRVRFI